MVNGGRDPLYMMYTSGSTGLPKGALIRHDGALNHIFAEFRLLRFHPESAFLQSAPVSSDISVWQCLGPLLVGGRVVFADYETMCSPPVCSSLIRHERTTLIELVPTVLEALIDHASGLPATDRALPDLEWAMVTGESASVALGQSLVRRFGRMFPLVNAYGPTEAADDICQHVMRGAARRRRDRMCRSARRSTISLFCARSPARARSARRARRDLRRRHRRRSRDTGSSRQPDRRQRSSTTRTRTRRSAPCSIAPATSAAGATTAAFEFLGRIDHQVKIRGFRVELGEIEAALTRRTDVREAIVVDHLDQRNERQLVAYVQARRRSDRSTGSRVRAAAALAGSAR